MSAPYPIVFTIHHNESDIQEIRSLSTLTSTRFDILNVIHYENDTDDTHFQPLWYSHLIKLLIMEIREAVLSFPYWTDDPTRSDTLVTSLAQFQTTLLEDPSCHIKFSHGNEPQLRFDHHWLHICLFTACHLANSNARHVTRATHELPICAIRASPSLVDPNDDYADDYHYNEFYWTGSRYLLVFRRPDWSPYARSISPDATYLYHRDLPLDWIDDPLADWAQDEIDLDTPDGVPTDRIYWFEDFFRYLPLSTDHNYEDDLFLDWIGYDFRWGWAVPRGFRRSIDPTYLALFY